MTYERHHTIYSSLSALSFLGAIFLGLSDVEEMYAVLALLVAIALLGGAYAIRCRQRSGTEED